MDRSRFGCSVERDGCCVAQSVNQGPRLCWITPSSLAEALQTQLQPNKPLVLDMRSFSSFNIRHIKKAQNLSFPNILLSRMLKGFISIDALVTDPDLLTDIENADMVILYDSNSKPGNVRQELLKFSEMLNARFSRTTQRVLLGGMTAFENKFPNLCTSSKPQSPTKFALDTSTLERKERSGGLSDVNPVEVLPFLYLGSAKDSADVESLRQMGITSVLNITTTCPNFFESEFEYMSILVEDSPQTDLHSRLQQAIEFIESVKTKGGRVFVHCHAGISRSATVCIAYVMTHKRMSLEEAYAFVKSRRPIISPNLSFMGQLIQYQQDLISVWATETRIQGTTTVCTDNNAAISTSTDVVSTQTRSTSPKQSLTSFSTNSSPFHSQVTTERHAQESLMVSRLTDMLNHQRPHMQSSSAVRPPTLSASDRSFSLPNNIAPPLRNISKRKREELRLSLDLHNPARKSPQLSPCRVEAVNIALDGKLSQSLSLSSTCT